MGDGCQPKCSSCSPFHVDCITWTEASLLRYRSYSGSSSKQSPPSSGRLRRTWHVGRASLIKIHPHPTYTYTTYLLSQQYFLCSQTGAHLAALPAGTVLMSLSGARKDFDLSTSNRWTGGFALGSNYLIWSTNSLACMYSSARGRACKFRCEVYCNAMILQWNGECVVVVVIARMEFMTRVQAWLSFEWNCR